MEDQQSEGDSEASAGVSTAAAGAVEVHSKYYYTVYTSQSTFFVVVWMVITYSSRVWINRVRLLIHVIFLYGID